MAVIKLPMSFDGAKMELNLSLVIDGDEVAVVDTGVPGQADAILAQIAELGYEPRSLTKILLTHQDIDHIGSVVDLKEKTGAEVYASSVERPYIEGDLPSPKRMDPARLAQMPEFAAMVANLKRTKVEHVLEAGDRIDFAGGIKLIATPGHTPGHTSFYLERTKTLIAGDALTAADGKLNGPMPQATPDMESAMASVRDLQNLDIQTVVTYHGGLVTEDVPAQIRRVASE